MKPVQAVIWLYMVSSTTVCVGHLDHANYNDNSVGFTPLQCKAAILSSLYTKNIQSTSYSGLQAILDKCIPSLMNLFSEMSSHENYS